MALPTLHASWATPSYTHPSSLVPMSRQSPSPPRMSSSFWVAGACGTLCRPLRRLKQFETSPTAWLLLKSCARWHKATAALTASVLSWSSSASAKTAVPAAVPSLLSHLPVPAWGHILPRPLPWKSGPRTAPSPYPLPRAAKSAVRLVPAKWAVRWAPQPRLTSHRRAPWCCCTSSPTTRTSICIIRSIRCLCSTSRPTQPTSPANTCCQVRSYPLPVAAAPSILPA